MGQGGRDAREALCLQAVVLSVVQFCEVCDNEEGVLEFM